MAQFWESNTYGVMGSDGLYTVPVSVLFWLLSAGAYWIILSTQIRIEETHKNASIIYRKAQITVKYWKSWKFLSQTRPDPIHQTPMYLGVWVIQYAPAF